jgi:hypothetical protein
VSALAPGTCFDAPTQTATSLVTVVSCDQPHDRQLYARISFSGSYPGLDADRQKTRIACIKALGGAFVDPAGLVSSSSLFYYFPQQSSWETGVPQAWCTLAGQNSSQLNGDLTQSAASYTLPQLSYLKATQQTTLLRREVRDTIATQWKSALPIAAQLAQADRAEARALTTGSFGDADVNQSAAALAKDDLAEAQTADALAQVTSQSQWTAQVSLVDPVSLFSDANTVRSDLALIEM